MAGTFPQPGTAAQNLQLFAAINQRLVHQLQKWRNLDALTLDVGAVVLTSEGREVSRAELLAGERGYQALLVFCPELELVLGSKLCAGDILESAGKLELLEQVMASLPESVTHLTLRCDIASDHHALMDFCQNPESRTENLRRFGMVDFVIGAQQEIEEFRDEIERTAAQRWQMVRPEKSAKSSLECAELNHVPAWALQRSESEAWRFVGTRYALPGEFGLGHDECMARDGQPAYRLSMYISNMPNPKPAAPGDAGLAMDAVEMVRFAHERSSLDKNLYAALKQSMAEGPLPSGGLGANAAWWHLAALAMNLTVLILQESDAFDRDDTYSEGA